MKLKLIVGTLVLLILGFTVFGEHGLLNLFKHRKQTQALVEEADRIKRENQDLQQELERLKTDNSYIERLAREELGMVKPGEIVFTFADPSDKPSHQ